MYLCVKNYDLFQCLHDFLEVGFALVEGFAAEVDALAEVGCVAERLHLSEGEVGVHYLGEELGDVVQQRLAFFVDGFDFVFGVLCGVAAVLGYDGLLAFLHLRGAFPHVGDVPEVGVDVGDAAVFIYDGVPGGVGLAEKAAEVFLDILRLARDMVSRCSCESGCPACIHSPKCGNNNQPLSKTGTITLLSSLSKELKTENP